MATNPARRLYTFRGKNRQGQTVNGEVHADNLEDAKRQLYKQDIITTSLKKHALPLFDHIRRGKKIVPADIAIFTRQLATMIKAGIPLVQSFTIIADGAQKPLIKTLVHQIRDDVAAGASFADALSNNPDHFDDLFCSLVKAGETAGALETMLDRIATYKEKTEQLKAKIKKALTYPIAVMLVALVVTAILLIKVVPVFADTFASFHAELPAFTLLVLDLSQSLQSSWLYLLLAIGSGLVIFRQARLKSQQFVYLTDRYQLKLPIVGNIMRSAIIARFARTLATSFSAGAPLIEALHCVAGAAGNRLYHDAIIEICHDVRNGLQLHQAIKIRKIFPTLLHQMTAIGEESGALDMMLEKVAVHYEEAVNNAVDNLTSLLEPLVMTLLGIVIGGLLIAMYLPIFQLGNML
ncbi:MAG: type II secretion system F family protein [Porticoccaceae bacterium]